MRALAFALCGLFLFTAGAAEVELARGGSVSGWVMVRSGWERQPVVTVSARSRQLQFDLIDVSSIRVLPEDATGENPHVLSMKTMFIRKRADARSEAVSEIYPGFELKLLDESGGWLHVAGFVKNEEGYVPRDSTGPLVRFVTQGAESKTAETPSDATPPKSASPQEGSSQ